MDGDATVATVIRLAHVRKEYAGTVAVDDLDLEVATGSVCVLVGPSGCGKSTTLRMINRLIEPTRGRIEVDGVDVGTTDAVELRRRIGYVIQSIGLFPHQSVAENIATVPRLLRWPRARIRDRVDELLDLVGLDPPTFRDRYPAQLSGGQQQRVGVARALGADPPVLLMDEPFGAIDPLQRDRLQQEFLGLQARLRKTVVFVTHDIDEAVRLGDTIAVLGDGGVLHQHATPAEVLARPADAFVTGFVGADRGLKLLAVTAIDPRLLDRDGPVEGLASVPAEASLRHAVEAMLAARTTRVAVVDAVGTPLGVLDWATVVAAADLAPGGGTPATG
jgi:osmoprotectant transport system ATP-binding protein